MLGWFSLCSTSHSRYTIWYQYQFFFSNVRPYQDCALISSRDFWGMKRFQGDYVACFEVETSVHWTKSTAAYLFPQFLQWTERLIPASESARCTYKTTHKLTHSLEGFNLRHNILIYRFQARLLPPLAHDWCKNTRTGLCSGWKRYWWYHRRRQAHSM